MPKYIRNFVKKRKIQKSVFFKKFDFKIISGLWRFVWPAFGGPSGSGASQKSLIPVQLAQDFLTSLFNSTSIQNSAIQFTSRRINSVRNEMGAVLRMRRAPRAAANCILLRAAEANWTAEFIWIVKLKWIVESNLNNHTY